MFHSSENDGDPAHTHLPVAGPHTCLTQVLTPPRTAACDETGTHSTSTVPASVTPRGATRAQQVSTAY